MDPASVPAASVPNEARPRSSRSRRPTLRCRRLPKAPTASRRSQQRAPPLCHARPRGRLLVGASSLVCFALRTPPRPRSSLTRPPPYFSTHATGADACIHAPPSRPFVRSVDSAASTPSSAPWSHPSSADLPASVVARATSVHAYIPNQAASQLKSLDVHQFFHAGAFTSRVSRLLHEPLTLGSRPLSRAWCDSEGTVTDPREAS